MKTKTLFLGTSLLIAALVAAPSVSADESPVQTGLVLDTPEIPFTGLGGIRHYFCSQTTDGYVCYFEGEHKDDTGTYEYCSVEWSSGGSDASWTDDDDDVHFIECFDLAALYKFFD